MSCNSPDEKLSYPLEITVADDSALLTNQPITSRTARFRIANPSELLHLTIEVFRANANGTGGSGAAFDNWSLWAQASARSPVADLNQLVAAAVFATGDSYELESGIKALRGEVSIASSQDTLLHGPWVVRATWEPSPGCCSMPRDRLARLFAKCELSLEGAVLGIPYVGT
jgi:hypothetical protein